MKGKKLSVNTHLYIEETNLERPSNVVNPAVQHPGKGRDGDGSVVWGPSRRGRER